MTMPTTNSHSALSRVRIGPADVALVVGDDDRVHERRGRRRARPQRQQEAEADARRAGPEPRMSYSVGATRSSTTSGVSTSGRGARAAGPRSGGPTPSPITDAEVAQRAQQPDQQRRHRQDLPERRLGRQPEDAVLPGLGQRPAEHLQRHAHGRRPAGQPARGARRSAGVAPAPVGRRVAGCGRRGVRPPRSPARAGEPLGRTVLTRPVCTAGPPGAGGGDPPGDRATAGRGSAPAGRGTPVSRPAASARCRRRRASARRDAADDRPRRRSGSGSPPAASPRPVAGRGRPG